MGEANVGFESLFDRGHLREKRVNLSVNGLHLFSLTTHNLDEGGINQAFTVLKVVVEDADDTSCFFGYARYAEGRFGKFLKFLDGGIENRLTKWHVYNASQEVPRFPQMGVNWPSVAGGFSRITRDDLPFRAAYLHYATLWSRV